MTSNERLEYSKHRIKSAFKTLEAAKFLSQLFDWRQKGDYETLYNFDSESVNSLFEPVAEMISEIEKELNFDAY